MKGVHDITHPWPSDLPDHCPECALPFDVRINLNYDRYGMGNLLKSIAWWSPLPAFPLATWICMSYSDRGFIMAVALGTILPYILLSLLSLCFPMKRKLTCLKCGYTRMDKVKTDMRAEKSNNDPQRRATPS